MNRDQSIEILVRIGETTKAGNQMICIKIEQDAVEPIHKLSKEECSELSKYAMSDY